GPSLLKIRPPAFFEERAHQPLLVTDTGAPFQSYAFRRTPAQVTRLFRIGFRQFVTDVVAPTDFWFVTVTVPPRTREMEFPVIAFHDLRRRRLPHFDVAEIGMKQWHERAHRVVALARG